MLAMLSLYPVPFSVPITVHRVLITQGRIHLCIEPLCPVEYVLEHLHLSISPSFFNPCATFSLRFLSFKQRWDPFWLEILETFYFIIFDVFMRAQELKLTLILPSPFCMDV